MLKKKRLFLCLIQIILLEVPAFTTDGLSAEDGYIRPSPPDWVWTARRAAVHMPEETGGAEKYAQSLNANGINMVNIEIPAPGILDFDNPEVIKLVKMWVDACHSYGIKVIAHHMSLSLAGSETQGPPARYKDMLQIDAKTGSSFGGSYWWLCPNNPNVREAHLVKLAGLIKQTDLDGFYTDAVFTGNHACTCRYCSVKFTEETGCALPEEPESPVWGNFNDPVWRKWITWRKKSMGDFLVMLSSMVKSISRDKIVFSYYSGTGGVIAPRLAGMSQDDFARGSDMLGYELSDSYPYYSWQAVTHNIRYVSAVGNHFGIPSITLPYNCSDSEGFFTWAMSLSNMSLVWSGRPLRCFRWQENYQDLYNFRYQKPFADIAILHSSQTRDLYKGVHEGYYLTELTGWCTALSESGIPYALLIDPDITDERLKDYKILILPNVACLSKGQAEAIKNFVANGGCLIATHETSLYDETGNKLDDFGLAGLFGVSYAGTTLNTLIPKKSLDKKYERLLEGIDGEIKYRENQILVKETGKNINLADCKDFSGTTSSPAMLISNYAKGNVLYFAGKPGSEYSHRGINRYIKSPSVWDDSRNPLFKKLILNSIRFYNQTPSIKAANFPDRVMVNACEQRYDKTHRLIIHLLNVTGSRVKNGTVIPLKYEINYPLVKSTVEGEPMSIAVLNDRISKAYMVSPDFSGEILLDLTRQGVYTLINVPALMRYSLICLELK